MAQGGINVKYDLQYDTIMLPKFRINRITDLEIVRGVTKITYTRTRTHARTHTRTHAHAHARTHTHTHRPILLVMFSAKSRNMTKNYLHFQR